jgi:hypothetical protein
MQLTDIRVDPRPVAVVRASLGIAVVLNAIEVSRILHRVADGRLRFPVLESLPAPSDPAVAVYLVLAVLAGVAVTIGSQTVAAAVTTTVLNIAVLVWDQQTYSNHRFLVTVLVVYLIFARSDNAWAVSRRDAELVPWWPQLLMMTQLSICYFFAALAKVNPTYLPGDVFTSWLWLDVPKEVLPVLAVGSVLTEFFLAFGLWFRRTRYAAAAAGLALHLSIVVLMAEDNVVLFAFAVACVPIYGLFLTRPSMRALGRGQISQEVPSRPNPSSARQL